MTSRFHSLASTQRVPHVPLVWVIPKNAGSMLPTVPSGQLVHALLLLARVFAHITKVWLHLAIQLEEQWMLLDQWAVKRATGSSEDDYPRPAGSCRSITRIAFARSVGPKDRGYKLSLYQNGFRGLIPTDFLPKNLHDL